MSSEKVGIEKVFSDNPHRLLFPYRVGLDSYQYIDGVVKSVLEKVETEKSLTVYLVFVKGIPTLLAKRIRDRVVSRLEDVISEDIFIDMRVFTDISVSVLRHLELEGEQVNE